MNVYNFLLKFCPVELILDLFSEIAKYEIDELASILSLLDSFVKNKWGMEEIPVMNEVN